MFLSVFHGVLCRIDHVHIYVFQNKMGSQEVWIKKR
jgi:hypothetical protein